MNEKAQKGLELLKEAILEYIIVHGKAYNSDMAIDLGLSTSHEGGSHDYLTYSILGELLKEGKIEKVKSGTRPYYKLKQK